MDFFINQTLFPSVLGSLLSIVPLADFLTTSLHKKCRQASQTDELVEFMEIHIQNIYTFAFKEIAFAGKGFNRRIPSQRKHMFFAVQQAACAIALGWINAVSAITVI